MPEPETGKPVYELPVTDQSVIDSASPEVSRIANCVGYALAERGVKLTADDTFAAAHSLVNQGLAAAERDALKTARCPSCDHLTTGHQQDGCWYAVTTGTAGRDLICPCAVPAAAFAPTACRGCATSLATCWAEGARCCDACAHPAGTTGETP